MRWISLVVVVLTGPAAGGVVWDEAANGDLSGNRLAPTPVGVALGGNQVIGETIRDDLDYVTFQVPPGAHLTALVLDHYASEDFTAFIGLQAGSVFTEPNVGANPANLLGYSHFGDGVGNVGTDILDDIGQGAGSQGFTPPLPAGDYTLWIQQTGMSLTDYAFDLRIEAVPEPSPLALGLAAIALAAAAPWRKTSYPSASRTARAAANSPCCASVSLG